MYLDRNEAREVTLNVDGSWRPTLFETDQTAVFHCWQSEWTVTSEHGVEFHGAWNEEDAKHFARSMGNATVNHVEPYWYVPTFGEVTPDEH